MNNIKTFEAFTEEEMVNESIMNFIKKLPFYEEAKEVYLKLKDKIEEYLLKLPESDLEKIKSFSPSYNENFELTFEKKDELVNKVLNIFGLSSASIGLLSGMVSMIITEINKDATPATPWFIAAVILIAAGGTFKFFGTDFDENRQKSKVRSKSRSKSRSRRRDPYFRG